MCGWGGGGGRKGLYFRTDGGEERQKGPEGGLMKFSHAILTMDLLCPVAVFAENCTLSIPSSFGVNGGH